MGPRGNLWHLLAWRLPAIFLAVMACELFLKARLVVHGRIVMSTLLCSYSCSACCIVALKSMYPLLSLLCTKISSCGCAERWWAIHKVCRVGRLT